MFGLCFRFGSAVPLYQLFGVLLALAVHGFQFHAAVQHTAYSKSRPAGRNFRCLRGGFLRAGTPGKGKNKGDFYQKESKRKNLE